jgi:hypothetical protein
VPLVAGTRGIGGIETYHFYLKWDLSNNLLLGVAVEVQMKCVCVCVCVCMYVCIMYVCFLSYVCMFMIQEKKEKQFKTL